MRKTIDVQVVKEKVNRILDVPTSTKEGRIAVSVLLESILMETDNYKGFGYLSGYKDDDTRRRYF